MSSFCFQLDLLTLKARAHGRDEIERRFFGEIDTKGAAVRDVLIAGGPNCLDGNQRCDFARLLLSLEARRPSVVDRLRREGAAHLVSELDSDFEILAALEKRGIGDAPSTFVEEKLGWSLEDHALAIVQGLTDNPRVGHRLINSHWGIKRLDDSDGTLVLSDRPLVRHSGFDKPDAIWALPLGPQLAFIACNDQSILATLMAVSGQRFVKKMNRSSALQAERFVFSVDRSHERWLEKYLSLRP